jgi:hypothetical protein
VDGSDTGEQTVNSLHANGSKAICYMSVGSWENRKPDENKFPNEVLGNDYDGWPGERWLDIRRIGVLAPIMGARMYVRKRKGFDAVEPDNMGGSKEPDCSIPAGVARPATPPRGLPLSRWDPARRQGGLPLLLRQGAIAQRGGSRTGVGGRFVWRWREVMAPA